MEKVNIVKIWSDSVSKENLEKILSDAKKWRDKTWEKFVFISSWAVKLGKDRIKSLNLDINNFSNSSLSSIGQKYLMRLYGDIFWEKELVA